MLDDGMPKLVNARRRDQVAHTPTIAIGLNPRSSLSDSSRFADTAMHPQNGFFFVERLLIAGTSPEGCVPAGRRLPIRLRT